MTTFISTLVDLLRTRALEGQSDCAFRFLADGETESECLTYGELDAKARKIAAWLSVRLQKSDRVLIELPPGLTYIESLFGCLYAGAIAVPAYPRQHKKRQTLDRIDSISRDCAPRISLTQEEVAKALSEIGPDEWKPIHVSADQVAILQYTSGSTLEPKGVILTHENILSNLRMIQEACEHRRDTGFVSWLPPHHDMGLIGNTLQPLWLGAQCTFMTPLAFLQRPVRWLNAVSKYRAHTSGGPNFGYDLCTDRISQGESASLDLSSWKIAFNGAEPVRRETLERFHARFCESGLRFNSLTPCYGLAEATLMVSCKPAGEQPHTIQIDTLAAEKNQVRLSETPGRRSRDLVSCGRAVSNTRLRIVNPESCQDCRSDEIGEIWINGPSVSGGYWGNPQESSAVFNVEVQSDSSLRYFRTGDLGFLKNDELFIAGRLKDLMIIRGSNHHPEDIEWSVHSAHPGIVSSVCFSISSHEKEQVVVIAEISPSLLDSRSDVIDSIRQAVSQSHQILVDIIAFCKPRTLPRTSSGKVRRQFCRSQFLGGYFGVPEVGTL